MREIAYLLERFPSFGQTFCYREVAELERQGMKVDVYSIRQPSGEPEQDWDQGIVDRVHYLPDETSLVKDVDQSLRGGKVSKEVREILEKWDRKPDFLRLYQAIYVGVRLERSGVRHVHAHFAGMAARTAWWIRKFFGIPYSFTAHANDIFAPSDFVVSLANIVTDAQNIVTVSDFAVGLLKNRFPDRASNIRRVYNGVDLSRFRATDFGDERATILSIGRLIEKKGFGDLITSCRLLQERGCRFRAEIIGEGPLQETLLRQIAKHGLERVVSLVGPQTQSQIAARLGHATLFVLPCIHEKGGGMDNLPTVIIEAMAAGVPIISTPIAGVPEMVENGVNGYLVPEHDPEAICAAVEKLINDPEQLRRLGDRGREMAKERFSVEANVRALRQIFD